MLFLIDEWLCGLDDEVFIETLPPLRRTLSGFDVGRKRMVERIAGGRREPVRPVVDDNSAFEQALPLLRQILRMDA